MRPTRHGVTLMEVMISIFVLSVGMLGVAALIPIGRYTLVEAGKADRSGACGRAAMREIKTRRLLECSDTTSYYWDTLGYSSAANTWPDSYCLDPLGVARAANDSAIRYFPAQAVNVIDTSTRLPRVSLFTPGSRTRMPLQVAERIFTWSDDKSFFMPDDRRQRPRPLVFLDTGAVAPYPRIAPEPAGNPMTVESEGKYSWMVTLSPFFDGRSATTIPPPDQWCYNATVVVFFGRDFGLPQVALETPSERVVRVQNFTGLNVGSGRVLLQSTRRGWLDLENHQFIALVGKIQGGRAVTVAYWYRVVMMGEIASPAPGNYTRYVSLEGPNWPNTTSPTYAVLMTGAIGAYTIPMERENNPLWVR